MEARIISLFLLMAAAGCCATLPIPYLAFRVQRIQPQQFFYTPPQRNLIQPQFIPNYEPPRYLQPQSYSQPESYPQPQFYVQPQPYVQPQQYPYNLYNAPQPLHRDAVSPVFTDHYDTVMHYVQRQPVVPFPSYARKPLLLQGPPTKPYLFKDCLEKDLEQDKINNKLAATAQAESGHVRRMFTDQEDEVTPVEPPTEGTRIPEEENIESTNFGAGIADVRFGNPGEEILQENAAESTSSEDKVGTANPANPQEGILEDISKSTNSEDELGLANSANRQEGILKDNISKSMNSEVEVEPANPENPLKGILKDNISKSTNSEDEVEPANPENPQKGIMEGDTAKSTNSEEKVTTVNPPIIQAKSTNPEDEATTVNPPNPQGKSTNSQDNETTGNPPNPLEERLQDLIAESTTPLGKPPAISEAAKPSNYPQRETLMAPNKIREKIPKEASAKFANQDSETTEPTESGLDQQNPTVVVAPPKNNESPVVSDSAETKSTSDTTSTASHKFTS